MQNSTGPKLAPHKLHVDVMLHPQHICSRGEVVGNTLRILVLFMDLGVVDVRKVLRDDVVMLHRFLLR